MIISKNGLQEEDQEGIIRLRNNVVHFVSDGCTNNNNSNSLTLAAGGQCDNNR
jgi:hypothetical protein